MKLPTYHMHLCVRFLEGEQSDVETPMEWNIDKKLALQKDIKNPSIKNHRSHTWYNTTFLFYSFDMYFLNTYDVYCSYVL
jgi:hypothetical protein